MVAIDTLPFATDLPWGNNIRNPISIMDQNGHEKPTSLDIEKAITEFIVNAQDNQGKTM